jgi:hypothetical protein
VEAGGANTLNLLCVLCVQVNTWRTATETCTKEKDFYYSKLRAIELLCNTPGITGNPVSTSMHHSLAAVRYATCITQPNQTVDCKSNALDMS